MGLLLNCLKIASISFLAVEISCIMFFQQKGVLGKNEDKHYPVRVASVHISHWLAIGPGVGNGTMAAVSLSSSDTVGRKTVYFYKNTICDHRDLEFNTVPSTSFLPRTSVNCLISSSVPGLRGQVQWDYHEIIWHISLQPAVPGKCKQLIPNFLSLPYRKDAIQLCFPVVLT